MLGTGKTGPVGVGVGKRLGAAPTEVACVCSAGPGAAEPVKGTIDKLAAATCSCGGGGCIVVGGGGAAGTARCGGGGAAIGRNEVHCQSPLKIAAKMHGLRFALGHKHENA